MNQRKSANPVLFFVRRRWGWTSRFWVSTSSSQDRAGVVEHRSGSGPVPPNNFIPQRRLSLSAVDSSFSAEFCIGDGVAVCSRAQGEQVRWNVAAPKCGNNVKPASGGRQCCCERMGEIDLACT
jgi:hypothetical protein